MGHDALTRRDALARIALASAVALMTACTREHGETLTIYAAVDRDTAAPILAAFAEQTGADLNVVYDSEAAKTVGLAKRVELERDEPRADVWWSGEALYTALLDQRGCLAPLDEGLLRDVARDPDPRGAGWIGFGLRLRVLVYREDLWPRPNAPPARVADLADPLLRGRVALARPVVGTSATHAAWLASSPEGTELLRAIAANEPLIVAGNAVVVRTVARGQALLGLTDSDDVLIGREDDSRLRFVIPDQDGGGAIWTPSTAGVIAGAPNAALARRFVLFLAGAGGEDRLSTSRTRNLPVTRGVPPPPELPSLATLHLASIDVTALATGWPATVARLESLFGP